MRSWIISRSTFVCTWRLAKITEGDHEIPQERPHEFPFRREGLACQTILRVVIDIEPHSPRFFREPEIDKVPKGIRLLVILMPFLHIGVPHDAAPRHDL